MKIISEPEKPSFLQITTQEPSSLFVEWGAPETAANCVQHYRITIDSGVNPSFTDTTNGTNYTFNNLSACIRYAVYVTPVDWNNGDAGFVTNKTRFNRGE